MKNRLCVIGVIFIIILISTSCKPHSSNQQISANLNQQFQLKIDQTAFLKNENIIIKFLNVTQDSRCPSDVVCVWEGQVTALINIFLDDEDLGNFELTSRAGYKELALTNFSQYSIKLIKVEPWRTSKQRINIEEYIITLFVSKK